jgi:hypothetical protein
MSAQAEDYDVSKPTRIKLYVPHHSPHARSQVTTQTDPRSKETSADKAERLYRREQRRLRKEHERIYRANGLISPPRSMRPDSTSPPRRAAKQEPIHIDDDDDDDVPGPSWAQSRASSAPRWGTGRALREALEAKEMAEKIAWMGQEELGRYSGGLHSWNTAIPPPTTQRHPVAQHIPRRFRDAAGMSSVESPAIRVELSGGRAPALNGMDEEEYTEYVRRGMYRIKHKAEVEAAEAAARDKEEKERARDEKRRRAEKEEKRRMDKLRAEKGRKEEERLRIERERWRRRWKTLGESASGEREFEEVQLGYKDVPWPVYGTAALAEEGIRVFLYALADDGLEDSGVASKEERDKEVKKVLREAIRIFHPDRFFGRYLGKVRESEKDKVKEGVEKCSRVINELAATAK